MHSISNREEDRRNSVTPIIKLCARLDNCLTLQKRLTNKEISMNFYATKEDRADILEFVFSESSWQLYDSYSEYGEEIQKYTSIEQVESKIARTIGTSLFVIYSPEFEGKLEMTRIELNPKHCEGHTYRYRTDGWGLIHIHFSSMRNNRLDDSQISHNSEKRANAWFPNYPELRSPDLWNWKAIEKASRKIEYRIKKASVEKYNSGFVMPKAKPIDKWPMR